MDRTTSEAIEVDLTAVIVAVTNESPRILVVSAEPDEGLPSGSLDPSGDRTLDLGMRRWVREQTGIELGYIEQLYTFGDRDRFPGRRRRLLSIAYLALVREQPVSGSGSPQWRSWFEYLPWEDWRDGRPGVIDATITPSLLGWVDQEPTRSRAERMAIAFRLRGKLSYRPVVFELLPETFTLNQLMRVVEALVGRRLHKPNFRRLVEQGQLVERTGSLDSRTGGRPAELFRFRREVLLERPAPGLGLGRRSR